MGRRHLEDQDQAGEAVDVLSQRPTKRDRSWETGQRSRGVVVTYRGIPRELQERIKAIASEQGIKIGELARRFLEYALDAYDAGDLSLDPVEVAGVQVDRKMLAEMAVNDVNAFAELISVAKQAAEA